MPNKTFYVTTPIYYPSGKPHVGHAYSTVLADVLAKYKKLIGYEVFFSTGTDEHGKKIEQAAIKANKSTIDFIDENVKVFQNLWKLLGIDYSRFVRTTNIEHIRMVQKIFDIYDHKGLIYLGEWKSQYCVACEENYTSKDIKTIDNKDYCPIGHLLEWTSEYTYFFRMSKFQDWIVQIFNQKHNWIEPQARVNELTNNFLQNALTDLSISRTSFKWGIPILKDQSHVMYVWMDALFNYLSVLGYLSSDDSLYQKFWNHQDAEVVHLLSKEITRFHCVYWPIFLHNLDVRLPTKIISHGWIITSTGKMSKSLGNVIDPFVLVDTYSRDCLRYYLIKDMSLVNDNVFSLEAMIGTYNGDLANNYGNLLSRTLGMLKKYFQNTIPNFNPNQFDELDMTLLENIKQCIQSCYQAVQDLTPALVLEQVQALINHANKYIELKKPWELLKQQATHLVENVLSLLVNVVKISTFWLQPVLCDGIKLASEQYQFNFSQLAYDDLFNFNQLDEHKVGESSPIFVRKEINNPKE